MFRPRPVADEFAHIYLEEGQEKTHGGLLQLMDLLAGPGRLLESWSPLQVYVSDVRKPRPDFWYPNFGDAEYVVTDGVRSALEADCDLTGDVEFLPLACPDVAESLWLMHATNWPNVLEESRCTYDETTDGLVIAEFIPSRLGDCSLFKVQPVRDSPSGDLLTVVNSDDPEHGFKPLVERSGFSGLRFELVWSSSGEPLPFEPTLGS